MMEKIARITLMNVSASPVSMATVLMALVTSNAIVILVGKDLTVTWTSTNVIRTHVTMEANALTWKDDTNALTVHLEPKNQTAKTKLMNAK